MAKYEQDREDLMREASALSPRAELTAPAFPESIVFGFRSSGGLSIYFGADPVYQFNSSGELRRAYAQGNLFKAFDGRLQQLHRERSSDQVTLWQSDLTDAQQAEFLGKSEIQIKQLALALSESQIEVIEEIPAGSDAIKLLSQFLARIESPPKIALLPNAR